MGERQNFAGHSPELVCASPVQIRPGPRSENDTMQKSPFPALIYGWPFDAYTAFKAEHFSALKALEESPRHYLSKAVLTPSPALRLGRAIHELICDPRAATIVVYDGIRRGKEWDAFSAEHAAKTILNKKEHETALEMRAAIEQNETAAEIFSKGRGESTIIWDDGGGRGKGRVDWTTPNGGLVELKTANRVTPRSFASSCVSLLYHAQMAFYSHGLTLAQGFTPPTHTIVALEKKPPFDVVVYKVGTEVIEAGARKVLTWLETLKKCRFQGKWPGISGEGMIDLVLPDWALTDGLPEIELNGDDNDG